MLSLGTLILELADTKSGCDPSEALRWYEQSAATGDVVAVATALVVATMTATATESTAVRETAMTVTPA